MPNETCADCGESLTPVAIEHADEGFGHEGLCCDCHDVSCGKPLEQVNAERASKNKPPLALKPIPSPP